MDRSYWRTVSLVFAWQMAASICYYAIFAATPFFRDAFGLSRFEVGVIVTVLSLGYATFLLPIGAATDRYGEKRTLTVGLLGLSATIILVIVAPTYLLLLVAVFLLGSLYGTAMPGTNKAIFDSIARGRQNFAMGLKQVGVTAGSGISSLLVTGLAGVLFWQSGFLVAAGFSLLVAGLFYTFYVDTGGHGSGGFPDFNVLFSNRPYVFLVAAGFFLGGALFTTTGYTVLYVEESIGASVLFGGIVLALVQLFGSFGRILTGWLSDVLPGDPQTRISSILIIQTIGGAALFVVVAWTSTPVGAAIGFSLLGFFILGYTGVYYSVMATVVPAGEIGSATAGGQVALTSGSLVAPLAFGYLADTVGYRASWLLLAAATGFAALLLAGVLRNAPPTEQTAMNG